MGASRGSIELDECVVCSIYLGMSVLKYSNLVYMHLWIGKKNENFKLKYYDEDV